MLAVTLTLIRDRQADYYAVLGQCDRAGKSTAFIEFALEQTLAALKMITSLPQGRMSADERVQAAQQQFGRAVFSRKDYLVLFPGLSPATASRDLQQAVVARLVVRDGDKATARYRFKSTAS